MSDRRERVVIVGGGVAGLRAAERLRELHFEGELVIISEERYRPYHRPALTKQLLTGEVRPRDIVLPVHTELDAIWRYGTRASYLEPDEHTLHLPGGEEIEYDGLVIATGVQARHLPGAPRHDPRVHVLRTVADAVGIQKAIAHGKGSVAVVGGGFVGCEIASSARQLGRDATIILRESSLLDKVPGPGVSETVEALHRSNGVQIVKNARIRHWVPQSDGIAMHLASGQIIVAGCVVLGVGGVPAVDWLRGSGLILDNGVMCDATCHAVGASDIVVAGDVARWPNLLFDTVPRRVEHWLNGVEMGRAAAENLLLGKEDARPFTPLPRFWSDQHGVKIQAAGIPALASDTVSLAGSVRVGHRVTGYVSNGQLVGVVGWDSPRGMLKWTEELSTQLTEAQRERVERPVRRQPAVQQPAEAVATAHTRSAAPRPAMAMAANGSSGYREPVLPPLPPPPPPRPPVPPRAQPPANGHDYPSIPPATNRIAGFNGPPRPRANGYRPPANGYARNGFNNHTDPAEAITTGFTVNELNGYRPPAKPPVNGHNGFNNGHSEPVAALTTEFTLEEPRVRPPTNGHTNGHNGYHWPANEHAPANGHQYNGFNGRHDPAEALTASFTLHEEPAAPQTNGHKNNGFTGYLKSAEPSVNGHNGHAKPTNGHNGHTKPTNGHNGHPKPTTNGHNGHNGSHKPTNGHNGHTKPTNGHAHNGNDIYKPVDGHSRNGFADRRDPALAATWSFTLQDFLKSVEPPANGYYNRSNGHSGYHEPVEPPADGYYNRSNGHSGYHEPVPPPSPYNRHNGFSGYYEPVGSDERDGMRVPDLRPVDLRAFLR